MQVKGLFCDEKIFTLDRSRNSQNDRYLAEMKSIVLHVSKIKNATSVMVFVLVSSDGQVMPPHFFMPTEEVNRAVVKLYINLLRSKVIPWMEQNADPPYVFQLDSSTCHA